MPSRPERRPLADSTRSAVLGAALCGVGCVLADAARAQDGGTPPPNAAEAGAPVELAPVTVTGGLLDRSIEETTSAVTVVPGDRLPAGQNRDVFDGLRFVPNAVDVFPGGLPYVRGVDASGGPGFGGGAAFSGARPRATLFVDGVPQLTSISRAGEPGTFDVAQTEFLRGTQSTTLGRNSLAGAFVVRTEDPTFGFEAKALAGYRNQDPTWNGGVALSGPIIDDQLAFRVAAERQEGEPFVEYTSPTVDAAQYEQDDFATLRGKLLFLPEALPELSAKLTYARVNDQEPSAPNDATGPDFFDRENNDPGFGFNRTRADSVALELAYELTESWRLEFLPNYLDATLDIETPDGVLDFEDKSDQYVAELRAVYEPAGGRARAVAGLFGYRRVLSQVNDSEALAFSADDELNTLSAFGEATVPALGPFDLIAGGRVERETQERSFESGFGASLDFDVDEEATVFLPKLGLVYNATDDVALGVVAQRGYNAGGGAVSFETATPYVFDKETSWTYELSLRSTWLDDRLSVNANAFYTGYQDFQVFAAGPGGVNDTITLNAPEARTYGLEVEVAARPSRGVDLFANLGLLNTEFTDFEDAAQDYGGNEFIGAPNVTVGVGGAYAHPSGVRLVADARYVGDYHVDIENDSDDESGDYFVTNARVEYTRSFLTVFGFVNNLFNKQYFLSAPDESFNSAGVAVIGAPRTVGLGAEVMF